MEISQLWDWKGEDEQVQEYVDARHGVDLGVRGAACTSVFIVPDFPEQRNARAVEEGTDAGCETGADAKRDDAYAHGAERSMSLSKNPNVEQRDGDLDTD